MVECQLNCQSAYIVVYWEDLYSCVCEHTSKFSPLRIPTRKPSVQKQKDARKGFSGDAEDQKKLVQEENLQKKSAEERTKKAASTQSRQLSDLVNYTGEPNVILNVTFTSRGAQVQWIFGRAEVLADVVVFRNQSFAALC